MKITGVEIVPINQEHKGRLIFSSGPTPAPGEFIIVRIKTDEGIEGVGSAYSFPSAPLLASGCSREGAMHLMKDLATVIIGQDPMRLSYILELMEKAISGWFTENWYILSNFDHALYDLKGKILDLPVYELLGGLVRDSIPLEHIQSFLPTPEEVAEEAKKFIDAGYKSVKVHVNNDSQNAKARVKAVRKAIGDSVPLAIDMGMAYTAPDAARLLEYLDGEYRLNFAEQPLHPYDISGMQSLSAKTKVPLTADHAGMSLTQAHEYMKLNVFDNFHCLLTRIGGIRRAVKFCDMMDTARLNYQICNQGNSIAGAAAAHVAASRGDRGGRYLDELGLYLYLHGTVDTKSIRNDIVKEQAAVIEKGVLYAPKGPGLGVELDEEMLKNYAAPGLSVITVK
ncbi:MAG: mandelate racemase/muconate lactonizing enzyme family protein [Clostridiales Family XIII bacterium]|jgi:muconate cycloisomerase|nr:mandelate racemase/muconate lactonizing enzyme family protein [Clostridiales Family XIII bacterium]